MWGDFYLLNGILPSFSHGEEGEVLDAGDTWEYLYVLNRKRLVSAALDPDVAQGKRSFLAGRLAVLHPRGFDRSRQCVAAAVAGLDAENVTVPFREYIKNVASSEVYPTWHPAALRANILAQVSFALNRIYTEFYPSRGYDFNITSSTAYDQKFIHGRNIFDSVSELVDDLFNDYLRRQGYVEPLAWGIAG